MDVNDITEKIISCVYTVSNTLGGGFAEKVYENATAIELGKTGLSIVQQYAFEVKYDGIVVGNYVADMLVAKLVLV